MQCSLPKAIRSLCRTGCLYRDPAFKHLVCPLTQKTDPCAAPCDPQCSCTKTTKDIKTNEKNLKKSLQ